MRNGWWLVAVLLLAARSTWGQSDSDIERYAQPHINSFVACAKPKVAEMAKGDRSPTEIAEAVIAACRADVMALRKAMKAPPFNQTDTEADQSLGEWLDQARRDMIADVQKLRS